jgi:hypothetical protein
MQRLILSKQHGCVLLLSLAYAYPETYFEKTLGRTGTLSIMRPHRSLITHWTVIWHVIPVKRYLQILFQTTKMNHQVFHQVLPEEPN